jgi:hypothetical protein
MQISVSPAPTILNGIFRVLFVPQHGKRRPKEPGCVRFEKLLLRVCVARDSLLDEIPLFARGGRCEPPAK